MRLKAPYVVLLPTYYRNTTLPEEDMSTDTIASYIELAVGQGWTVTPSSGYRLHWKHPDGKQQAYTPVRIRPGQDAKNCKSRLKSAGLVFDQPALQSVPIPTLSEPFPILVEEEIMAKSMPSLFTAPLVHNERHNRQESVHVLIRSIIDGKNGSNNTFTKFVTVILDGAEEIAKELSKDSEKVADETITEAMNLLAQAEKMAKDDAATVKRLSDANSKLGLDLKKSQAALAEQTERANKAENKLRMFRSALSED